MVDSMYGQPFPGGRDVDGSDEDLVVQDDELLVTDQPMQGESRRWDPAQRASRRAPRSGMRAGWTRGGDLLAGKYLVESVRGRSGSEMVVFARHVELEQKVRLRYLLPEASASPEAVARFQRGARKAREMRSEHAERVIDFGRLESGSPYRVTEMPGGPSLDEMLRVRGALSISEAVDILIAVCEPVAEAHAAGVIHRSLCTSSIFVERRADGSQLVKVLDFGVGDPLQSALPQGEGLPSANSQSLDGALAFAAPEQIRATAVDARADVWALGAVLYELLTGARVFEADTPLTLLAMIAADQPAPITWLQPEVPETLERIVLSCLEKDPNARPRSVVELAVALAPFGSGDAEGVAGRVTRIAMRSTRPPPLPSVPPSSVPAYARTRAIVRTPRPTPPPVTQKPPVLPSWATMTGGALVGISVALVAALVFRLQLPQPVQPAAIVAATAAPVAAPLPPTPPSPPVTEVTPATASPLPAVAGAALPRTPPPVAAEAPPPVAAQPRPQRRVESEPKAENAPAPRTVAPQRERPAPTAESVAAGHTTTAAPKALFGGID